ncbi:MAG TPA: hypothetical protein VKG67_03970 [Gallionellaceae bacterium]|nr:hypothetical protein [Gallionellaceae bacterium]
MPEKTTTTKLKAAPAKTPAAKDGKKIKKDKKATAKVENKLKIVRDSFTMTQNDYAKIAELKQACLKAGVHVKKSELIRAGLHALSKLGDSQLKRAITQLEQIKTGRPKKAGA